MNTEIDKRAFNEAYFDQLCLCKIHKMCNRNYYFTLSSVQSELKGSSSVVHFNSEKNSFCLSAICLGTYAIIINKIVQEKKKHSLYLLKMGDSNNILSKHQVFDVSVESKRFDEDGRLKRRGN